MYIEIETLKHSICFKLLNCRQSEIGIDFVGLLALIFIILPVFMIFYLSIEIKLGSILVCVFAWLISGYFFRLYLWNKYGEEIFVIKRDTIKRYNNYKFYKDKFEIYQFTQIEILFYINGEAISTSSLDTNLLKNDCNQLSIIGFRLNDETIISHREIPVLDIIKLAGKVHNFLVPSDMPSEG